MFIKVNVSCTSILNARASLYHVSEGTKVGACLNLGRVVVSE